ncbi:unnamed protein product [Fraxinus pennsylvanica]|uniref:60S acidic ribosomal protein P2 n=1 Tax=Fraxinus pennsylvanica TaxID=56036 RepID=A0AAD2A0E4_9LAMI|nr:unnamed protein product [Fraxinus pennsylvanica]
MMLLGGYYHLSIHIASTRSSPPNLARPAPIISLTNKMKVVAAYLLAVLGGNACPSTDDLKDILSSVGAEADDNQIGLLLTQVQGKDITELIAAGREKLASVPAGGGAVAVAASVAGATGGAAASAAAEPKKEEKVEEKEESDDDMGFSLFD